MPNKGVVLLDFWGSPFCLRVKIALAEKGVAYEDIEEKNLLSGKSELLLKSNPIHQKVPVLLHDGKPICESANIVAYIDETWPAPPLLPPCPNGRANARFWSDFIDKKVFDAGASIWRSTGGGGGGGGEVVADFIEIVKQLEGALGEKEYFGGDNFGFVDIMAISLGSWFCAYEKFGGFKVEDHCPKFSAWMKRCLERESVAESFPDPDNIIELVTMLRKMNGIE